MKNTKLRDSGDGAEVEGDEHPDADGVSSSASGTSSHYHRNRAAAAAAATGSSLESQVGNWPDNWRKERRVRGLGHFK